MENNRVNYALFDLDGTLCDYVGELERGLRLLKSPEERDFDITKVHEDLPEYIYERKKLITQSKEWWANLPKLQLGWDILKVAEKLGYKISILSQGPDKNPNAWAGKKEWQNKYLDGYEIDITRDKSRVYGRVLVDDFPDYASAWLAHRPRGLVIMPENKGNKNFTHPQLIRYNGQNLEEITRAMEKAKLDNNNIYNAC